MPPQPDLERLQAIKTLPSLVAYLKRDLDWPIETDEIEDVFFEYDPEELGLAPDQAAGIKEIKQLRPIDARQPWGIFWVIFEKKRLPVVMLRRILGHLVIKKRASANQAAQRAWHANDLLFISAYGEELAKLAISIRKRADAILSRESDRGPMRRLYGAFKTALIHDLSKDDFADVIAQTISYGLLAARFSSKGGISIKSLVEMIPPTNPFLRELLAELLAVAGRKKGAFDFDELGIQDVVDLLNQANAEAVKSDFGNKTRNEDPVIHFYEHFLKAYDKKKKVQRGVFFTPQPVVSYIVRSVHELLQTEFGLEDGLADTITWSEMAKRNKDLKIPDGAKPGDPFVLILDPATGTATFLVEVIEVIFTHLKKKWTDLGKKPAEISRLWNEYVPKNLLPRLYGYELMMAPYTIAHMKLALKLQEINARLGQPDFQFMYTDRAHIYLTNSLEPAGDDKQGVLEGIFPALAHEAAAVNRVKKDKRFTVVIGNPPYALLSANLESHHRALVESYKFVNGERIHERGALQMEKNLNDDYVKFIRLTQLGIERTGLGVSGLITNHSFLDNPTMRGVRWSLMHSASHYWLNDLHGNSTKQEQPPDGGEDVNVFQIKQGVAIALSVRLPGDHRTCEVEHHERWGTRQYKEGWLGSHHVGSHEWKSLEPTPDNFLFVPQSSSLKSEFEAWPSLPSVMPANGAGYITARDNLVVDFERAVLVERIRAFNASRLSDDALLKEFDVASKKGWDAHGARAELKRVDIPKRIIRTNYRPFDSRWIFFDSTLVWGRSWPTIQHVVGHSRNLTMLATRMTKDQWDVWVARTVSSHKAMSAYDTNSVFPLYLTEDSESSQRSLASEHRINISIPFLKSLTGGLGLKQVGPHGLPAGLTPEDIFHYIYAVLHSPTYRTRYAEFLKIDFPRLPLTSSLDLFRALAKLGGELVALHLMEFEVGRAGPARRSSDRSASGPYPLLTEFVGGKNPEVEKVTFSNETVWTDKAQSEGFRGVPEPVWSFHIGGYQVCEKWLKDRKGRTLSPDDITHYHRIVVALSETIRLMAEIDQVIEAHGGWPGAFHLSAETSARAGTGEAKAAPANVIPFRPRTVEPKPAERYVTCVPLVPLKAAAGAFGDPQHIEDENFEWVAVESRHRLCKGMFVAQVVGKSMEPAIPDGAFCLFRAPVEGTRQGRTVLVQLRDATDPETGARYTVKCYESEKAAEGDSWRHATITLKPLNPDFEPIVLTGRDEGELQVVAELVEVLSASKEAEDARKP
jgi:SOS-response transcriptional repressor LexA